MKRKKSIIAIAVLLMGLLCWVAASADTDQAQTNPASRHHRGWVKKGPDLLMRCVRQNLAVQALSDLTRVPANNIRQKLREERLPAVLQAYQVDWKPFTDAMQAKARQLVGYLAAGNYLDADQKNLILARMDRRAQRRALMKSLIDKAVTDGTITAAQARMLIKRR